MSNRAAIYARFSSNNQREESIDHTEEVFKQINKIFATNSSNKKYENKIQKEK